MLPYLLEVGQLFMGALQRFGSPAADSGKTRNIISTKFYRVPQRTHAEGGQVEPVLGSLLRFFKGDFYDENL
jgi:hypothetical protein